MALTLSTQRASASFISNESSPRWKYDVFLSFRGVDTRKGFVSHLYHELWECQGITTFFDDRELEGGTSIPVELPRAIKESHIAIVVLSPNYASSKWCLDELTTILQCMEGRESVLPVFYETDPSDVGNQRGCFAKAFTEHEEKFNTTEDKKKLTQWRADLKKVSKFSGWHLKNFKSERELINDIVKCVQRKVQATFTLLDSSRKLVGTDSALEQLSLLLAHDANDVHFIGITGMGGIGKTTLAKLVYNKICHHFGVHCFLANVREVCAKNGIVDLAKKLLFPFLRERIEEIWDEERVSILTEKFLHNKKVLLVLDDVDELRQLEVLAGNQGWFGMGSRIIVTTRNQRLLVQHGIETSYKVQGLNDAEALELFSLHAFKKDQPEEDFLELSKYFINHARGLPLALKIFGATLFKRGLAAWNSERDSLSKILNPTIFDKLKISYDGLEEREKSIFLDVACLHKGKHMEQVIEMLHNSNPFGMSSRIVIDGLIERSLLYQDHHNCIWMHDLIQEMAWKIIGDESKEPGLRSRLWLYEDIIRVFTTNTGTGAIEVISLCLPKVEEVRQWNCEALSKMTGLRFLEFDNLIFSSGPEFLPCSLRIINWSFYPSKFLPTNFHPHLLTELNMSNSNLVRLWKGKMDLPNLKYISLRSSNKLKSTPDFSGLPNLETLDLLECKNLVEIHPTIVILKRLKVLDLSWCESIKSLPNEVEMDSLEKIPSSKGHLVGLEHLYLRNCKNLLNLPRAICNLKSLIYLDVRGCLKIHKLPGDMDHLRVLELGTTMKEPLVGMKNLEYLAFEGSDAKAREGWGLLRLLGLGKSRPDPSCWGLVLSSLNRLCSLRELRLEDCEICEGDIPDDIGCLSFLESLELSGNNFVSLPESIRRLSKLERLNLDRCKSLQELPPLPSNSELYVSLDDCTSLKRLTDASKLSSRFTNLYDFWFTCKNCIALVQDEGWINTILSRILKFATEVLRPYSRRKAPNVVWPGSEIPEWFSNQSVGNSVNVELPPPSCTNWLGIAFCLVFQDHKQNLANPTAPRRFTIQFSENYLDSLLAITTKVGSFVSEHLLVFYFPREQCHREQFLFETYFVDIENNVKADFNSVKKCGARLVYKQDLEELNHTLKILKRTHEYRDEAASSEHESASFNDTEQIRKRTLVTSHCLVTNMQVTVCQTCGDKGIEDALLYCDKCQNYALHRYCLNVPAQNIFDEDLTWLCEDCDPVKPSRTDKSVRSTEICLNKKFKKRKKKSNRKTLPIYGAKKKVRKCEGANMKVQICEGPNMKVYEGANTKVEICEGSTFEHEAEGSNDCDNGEKLGSRCSEVHTDEFNSSDDVAKSVKTSLVTTCDPLKISAIICYVAAQPIIDPIWRGSLSIFNKDFNIVSGLVAHLSSLACPKVREEAELLPFLLFPELVNRTDVWPKAFEKCGPNDQSIALYFFPDNERDEKDFDTLVVSMIQDDLARLGEISSSSTVAAPTLSHKKINKKNKNK